MSYKDEPPAPWQARARSPAQAKFSDVRLRYLSDADVTAESSGRGILFGQFVLEPPQSIESPDCSLQPT
jgi:hypothetical protein